MAPPERPGSSMAEENAAGAPLFPGGKEVERETGFEPATVTLARWGSTGLSYSRLSKLLRGAQPCRPPQPRNTIFAAKPPDVNPGNGACGAAVPITTRPGASVQYHRACRGQKMDRLSMGATEEVLSASDPLQATLSDCLQTTLICSGPVCGICSGAGVRMPFGCRLRSAA